MAVSLGRLCGQCRSSARLFHQRAEETAATAPSWTRNLSTVNEGTFTPPWEDLNLLIKKLPQSPEDSQKHNPDWLISSLSFPSQDAARLWTCAWHLPSEQRPEETHHKQPLIVNLARQARDSKPSGSRHRLSPSGLDSGRSTTACSHLNPTKRSRHCSVPQRSAKVSQIAPAQMKTRNSHSLSSSKGCHDTGSPASYISKGGWRLAGFMERAISHWLRAASTRWRR